jgi:hypothetical protein
VTLLAELVALLVRQEAEERALGREQVYHGVVLHVSGHLVHLEEEGLADRAELVELPADLLREVLQLVLGERRAAW